MSAIDTNQTGMSHSRAWQRAFSRMVTTRPWVGWMSRRLCGSARPTTVGWISSYHMRPKQPWRPLLLPCLYVMHQRGHSRSPVGRNTVSASQPARPQQPTAHVDVLQMVKIKGRKEWDLNLSF